MSIHGIGNDMAHQHLQEMRAVQKGETAAASISQNDMDEWSKRTESSEYDEYIPGEKQEPIGLYKLVHDDEGNRIVQFDAPMQTGDFSPQEAEKSSGEAVPAKAKPGKKAETCTTNTDKVDREIEKLKKKREQLEQRLRTTTDPDKAEDLKRQLAQIKNELRQKDNDAYRRQHAVIS